MLIYLCGAIEYSPDHGKAWRAEVTRLLHELGHEVYDPALDEQKDLTDHEVREFRAWKHSDLPRFQQTIRKIIQYDLDWVEEKCDAIVAYWDDYSTKGAGTQGELTVAYRRGLPVYLVTDKPAEQISGWVLGCASHIFPNFEALRHFLSLRRKPAAVTA
ncbi:MAG: nucleoside 2-deoxyribosyltransferase [Acidobacteriota bacterium]|nr:nucleoside 2-deoxyribosyltransferase [Acidobacteriota bacterium]